MHANTFLAVSVSFEDFCSNGESDSTGRVKAPAND
jgi:hypothetical protein